MADETKKPEEQLAALLKLNKNQELNNKLKKESLELELKIATALGDQREIQFSQAELRKQELEGSIQALTAAGIDELGSQVEKTLEQQEQVKLLERQKEELYEINKQLDIGRGAAEESDKFWGSIAGRIGMGRTALDGISEGATRLAEKMKNSDEYAKQFAISFKESFSVTRLMSNVLMTMVTATAKLAMQADQASAAFAAATSMGNQFRDVIIDAGQSSRELGVGIKQSAEATQALVTGTTGFVKYPQARCQKISKQHCQH
jgi:hypothetical protein